MWLATLQALARHWATDYDRRACEAKLNALPQFMTEIDGVDIHLLHVKSPHELLPALFGGAPARAATAPAKGARRAPKGTQRARRQGAGDGNRTRVTSLEGSSSAIELHPRVGVRVAGRA